MISVSVTKDQVWDVRLATDRLSGNVIPKPSLMPAQEKPVRVIDSSESKECTVSIPVKMNGIFEKKEIECDRHRSSLSLKMGSESNS